MTVFPNVLAISTVCDQSRAMDVSMGTEVAPANRLLGKL